MSVRRCFYTNYKFRRHFIFDFFFSFGFLSHFSVNWCVCVFLFWPKLSNVHVVGIIDFRCGFLHHYYWMMYLHCSSDSHILWYICILLYACVLPSFLSWAEIDGKLFMNDGERGNNSASPELTLDHTHTHIFSLLCHRMQLGWVHKDE